MSRLSVEVGLMAQPVTWTKFTKVACSALGLGYCAPGPDWSNLAGIFIEGCNYQPRQQLSRKRGSQGFLTGFWLLPVILLVFECFRVLNLAQQLADSVDMFGKMCSVCVRAWSRVCRILRFLLCICVACAQMAIWVHFVFGTCRFPCKCVHFFVRELTR